jgi:uncharacterized protein YegJ (DUF2314 family)
MGNGRDPRFVAAVNRTMFMIYSVPKPYGDKSPRALQAIADIRLRSALQQQNAWFSIDFLDRQQATPESYRLMGRVLSHFADSDCVGIYYPPSNSVLVWTEQVRAALRSDDPTSILSGGPPIVWLGSNNEQEDSRLKAAEAEARRRFPEFESAFEAKRGTTFLIKILFSSGDDAEHMWVEVAGIYPDKVVGRLVDEAAHSSLPKAGSEVSVSREAVEDWAIMREGDDKIVGGFTDAVLAQIQAERGRK